MTQDNNRYTRTPVKIHSYQKLEILNAPMTHCREHWQVKLFGKKKRGGGILFSHTIIHHTFHSEMFYFMFHFLCFSLLFCFYHLFFWG